MLNVIDWTVHFLQPLAASLSGFVALYIYFVFVFLWLAFFVCLFQCALSLTYSDFQLNAHKKGNKTNKNYKSAKAEVRLHKKNA